MFTLRLNKQYTTILTQFNLKGYFSELILKDILKASSIEDAGYFLDFRFKRLKDARRARILLLEHLAAKVCNNTCPTINLLRNTRGYTEVVD